MPYLHIATTNHGHRRRIKACSGWDIAERVSQAVGRCSREPLQPFLSPLHIQGLHVRAIISVALPWDPGALLFPWLGGGHHDVMARWYLLASSLWALPIFHTVLERMDLIKGVGKRVVSHTCLSKTICFCAPALLSSSSQSPTGIDLGAHRAPLLHFLINS